MGISSPSGGVFLWTGHLNSFGSCCKETAPGYDSCSWLKLGEIKHFPHLALCYLGIHHMSCCPPCSSSCSTHFLLENFVQCLSTDHSHVFLSALPGGHLNLTATCNADCHCLQETYSPVCGSDDIMYYSPCHAGCKRVSKNLRNGKKVCLTALYINEMVTHLWNDLAGSAKVSTGLNFAAV